MISNGIGVWDTTYQGWRAPIVEEFRDGVKAHYRTKYGADSPQYADYTSSLSFEPHVGEHVINDLVNSAPSLSILRNYYPVAVERTERLIQAVIFKAMTLPETRRIEATSFIDATYEGDLAAVAGVPYRVGRESRQEYGEPHAGRIFTRYRPGQFPRAAALGKLNLRPFEMDASEAFAGSTGEGDGAIQAYNIRISLSCNPDNRRYPGKPANYDRSLYLGILKSDEETAGQAYPLKSHFLYGDVRDFRFRNWKKLPNDKLTWNHGNFPGQNHEYPTAAWPKRQEITQQHLDHELGLLYFLQNDEAVPEEVRERAREWGLSLNEFTDNNNLPWEMYVREARRIIGRYVFTEHDGSLAPGLDRAPIHSDSIAITEWPMDSHECTTERQFGSACEGTVLLTEATRPGQVPYRTLLPEQLDNLLVTFCVSASHMGWGTLRVEPTMLHIGEAAGFAVAMAHQAGIPPTNISTAKLQQTLVENGVMLSFFNEFDMQTRAAWVAAVQYLGTKGFFTSYNAQPEAPLTQPVAQQWVQSLGHMVAGTLNPNERARLLAQAATGEAAVLTLAQFKELLSRELHYRGIGEGLLNETSLDDLGPDETLTRGNTCRVIYQLLKALQD
jgi:hypothetical protein